MRPLVLPPAPLFAWQKIWMVFAALVAAVLVSSHSSGSQSSNRKDWQPEGCVVQ